MHYGISGLSLIPVRREPSGKSEMVTQILFGEFFEITEEIAGWDKVRLAWDGYTGWVDANMITPVDESTLLKIRESPSAVSGNMINLVNSKDDQNIMIVAGSTLPLWRPDRKEFTVAETTYSFPGQPLYGKVRHPRNMVVSQALKYLNSPYLWGGRSPFGIDCSGFSQIIYKMTGIRLPRDASQQAGEGEPVAFSDNPEPGDLAFFDNDDGIIVHVGIILKQNKIIHASGKVRIDNLDQAGIFNADLKRYTHKLRVMKKIINAYGTD